MLYVFILKKHIKDAFFDNNAGLDLVQTCTAQTSFHFLVFLYYEVTAFAETHATDGRCFFFCLIQFLIQFLEMK